jgi:hypothetical protein
MKEFVARSVRAALAATLGLAVLAAAAEAAPSGLSAYTVDAADGNARRLLAQEGYDLSEGRSGDRIEIVASAAQASGLRKFGLDPQPERSRASAAPGVRADGSYDVFRPYWDHTYVGTVGGVAGGPPRETIYEEFSRLAAEHPGIVKREIIGDSINGKPILALRITRDAREPSNPDGSRPAVAYIATQHAREWIVTEQARRLAHLFIDNYRHSGSAKDVQGRDIAGVPASDLTSLVNTREIWIVPVANPDGYDFTFTPGNRLWRKNLRDNNGDGQITVGDGVDPNRNFPTHWGFDNEGSSIDPAAETYRGTGPASEPETKAMNGLFRRVGFEFLVNYHSAAELLLYGTGFQVQTDSEDDPIYRALAGTDADPAIGSNPPGAPHPYDPDVSSELYTTNGDTDETAHATHRTLSFTPEMDVADPARGGGNSVFVFQDSEADLEQAFEKNIPFALDVAKSSADPANPVSHLGREAPSFEIHPFGVSFGDPQKVRVNAKRALGPVTLHWTAEGGEEHTAGTTEYRGGERYGGDLDVYYHELRGMVTGTSPGENVKVWFEAGGQRSQSFGYEVRSDTGHRVLIMAAEDYSGKPGRGVEQPAYASRTQPNYLGAYTDALASNGISYDVYDVDAEGRTAPDPMGVLSHYDAIVWYTGNDVLIRAADVAGGTGAAKLSSDEILAVRDYLNDGGKLLYTGQNAAFAQVSAFPFNPLGEPPYCDAVNPGSPGSAPGCIPLSNDFLQYWLGAYGHIDAAGSKAAAAALPFRALAPFGGLGFRVDGSGSADNQEHAYSMVTTSSILDPAQFPQFRSGLAATFARPPSFDPLTGTRYAVASSDDQGYQRLRRTIDLTGTTTADLSFEVSFDTEANYDYVIVEAHHLGMDDWTTLPDVNGHTTTSVGASCDINWDTLHPFLAHYQTNVNKDTAAGAADCTASGTTGGWNAATGNSGGYQDWRVDLSAYAGSQVELSISYVQDFGSGGLGVFVDDAKLTRDGVTADETSFEDGLGGFTAGPPPAGSETGTQREWTSRTTLGYLDGPGIQTPRSVYWGFGLEGVSGAGERAALMAGAMRHLGVLAAAAQPPPPAPPPPPPSAPVGGSTVRGRAKPQRVTIARRLLRADRNGRFGVGVRCPASTRGNVCRGSIRVVAGSRLLGQRTFSIRADRMTTMHLALTRSGRALLRRKGRVGVTVSVSTRGGDGVLRRSRVRLTLVRAPARR